MLTSLILQGTEPNNIDFTIIQGSTFNPTLFYAQAPLTSVPITGITKGGQAVVTSTHTLTRDWPVYVSTVTGMIQINHIPSDLKRLSRAYQAYYVSGTSLQLDQDSSNYSAYVSGGELLFHAPVALATATASMQIRPQPGVTTVAALEALTSSSGITLGAADGSIGILIASTVTAGFTFTDAVYDLLVTISGVTTRLCTGHVYVLPEITQ